MIAIWFVPLLLPALPADEPAAKPLPVQFRPQPADSKLAPRFSPKGTQIALTARAVPGLAGFDHLQGRLKLGPARNATAGQLVVLARSERGKPYDRLFLDAGHDGSVANDTPLSATPNKVRDKLWTTFQATVKVNHAAKGAAPAWEDYPLSFWVVVDKPEEVPTVVRFTRRGFLAGSVTLGGTEHVVLLADAGNDGVFGRGDSWTVRPAEAARPFTAQESRAVGDYAWAGGKAWKLELDDTAGRTGRLVVFDPGVTQAEDDERRDLLREDRTAPRAAKPVGFRADADAAIGEARAKKRPYFVKFETDWCVPCKQMDTYVFTARAVAEAAAGVVCVKVDGDKRKDLTERYKVKGYPTGILFGPDGEELARYSGYRGVKQMTEFFGRLK